MGVLSSQQIRAMLSETPPLVAGYSDIDEQLQANGFDMTLASIAEFTGAGRIGVSNNDRILAEPQELPFDAEGWVHLQPGVYAVRLNETVALPRHVMALAKPRSTLLRNGAAAHNAVWDAGYMGRSQIQVAVYNPQGLTLARNARIVQMVFFTLDEVTEIPYSGIYQGEATAPQAIQLTLLPPDDDEIPSLEIYRSEILTDICQDEPTAPHASQMALFKLGDAAETPYTGVYQSEATTPAVTSP